MSRSFPGMEAALIWLRFRDNEKSADGYEHEDGDEEDQERDALESASENGLFDVDGEESGSGESGSEQEDEED